MRHRQQKRKVSGGAGTPKRFSAGDKQHLLVSSNATVGHTVLLTFCSLHYLRRSIWRHNGSVFVMAEHFLFTDAVLL